MLLRKTARLSPSLELIMTRGAGVAAGASSNVILLPILASAALALPSTAVAAAAALFAALCILRCTLEGLVLDAAAEVVEVAPRDRVDRSFRALSGMLERREGEERVEGESRGSGRLKLLARGMERREEEERRRLGNVGRCGRVSWSQPGEGREATGEAMGLLGPWSLVETGGEGA